MASAMALGQGEQDLGGVQKVRQAGCTVKKLSKATRPSGEIYQMVTPPV